MNKRTLYNCYGLFLHQKFGEPVHKVIVDAGFTCPNRDGILASGGCLYCNTESYTPGYPNARIPVREQVHHGIEYLKTRRQARKFIVYFQPNTNTYAPVERLAQLYTEALDHPDVVGLSVGTRPDCVDAEKLSLLGELAKRLFVTVEYGIESIHDKTLRFTNRAHDYATTQWAMAMSQGRGLYIGAHIILGFPTETKDDMLATAEEISTLGIDFLKIHNLHIVKGTRLGKMYLERPFPVFEYQEYLDLLCQFLERLSPRMVIERFVAETPPELLIAPRWGKPKAQILADIERRLAERESFQGKRWKGGAVGSPKNAEGVVLTE